MSSEWTRIQIKQLGRIVTGKTPSTSRPDFFDGDIPFLTPTDMTDGVKVVTASRRLTQAGLATIKNCLIPKGVAVSCIGWQMGKSVLVLEPTVTNQQINTVVVDESRFDLHFVYYLMTTMREKIFQHGATATRTPIINKSSFGELGIFIPHLSVQKRIAEFFSCLDDRIALLRETNATLEAMAQALFKSWFVDFDPVHANAGTRAATLPAELQALFPSTFIDTPQGLVPEGWRVGVVGDVVQQKKGSVNPLQAPERLFEHYSLPAFDNNQIPVLEQGEQIKSNKTPLPPNAVLLSKLNPHIPRVWLPFEYGDNAVCSTEFLAYSPINGASKEFVYTLFTSVNFLTNLRQLVTGTSNSHQRVKPDHILGLELVIPTKGILAEFENAVKPLFARIGQNRLQTQTLATLRDTLLPRLISGQLRLPDAEAAMGEVDV